MISWSLKYPSNEGKSVLIAGRKPTLLSIFNPTKQEIKCYVVAGETCQKHFLFTTCSSLQWIRILKTVLLFRFSLSILHQTNCDDQCCKSNPLHICQNKLGCFSPLLCPPLPLILPKYLLEIFCTILILYQVYIQFFSAFLCFLKSN